MTDNDPTFTNIPPADATLVPVAAFSAFHNNFTGIPRTGEMKLTLTIPINDIHDALDVTSARDEILWVQVSKLRFGGENVKQLAATIAAQQAEREALNPPKVKAKRATRQSISTELDWET